MCVYACNYVYIYLQMHVFICVDTCAENIVMKRCIVWRTHVHTHTCTHAHAHTRTHAHMHTRTHAHTHTHTHTHAHTHTHIRARAHTHKHARTHTHTHTHTQMHTHTHANAHTHTHKHTVRTYSCLYRRWDGLHDTLHSARCVSSRIISRWMNQSEPNPFEN